MSNTNFNTELSFIQCAVWFVSTFSYYELKKKKFSHPLNFSPQKFSLQFHLFCVRFTFCFCTNQLNQFAYNVLEYLSVSEKVLFENDVWFCDYVRYCEHTFFFFHFSVQAPIRSSNERMKKRRDTQEITHSSLTHIHIYI